MEYFLQFAEEFRDKVNVQLMTDVVIEMVLFIHAIYSRSNELIIIILKKAYR